MDAANNNILGPIAPEVDNRDQSTRTLDPKASLFRPGAKEHYLRNAFNLELNLVDPDATNGTVVIKSSLKRKCTGEEIALDKPNKKVTFDLPSDTESSCGSSTGGSFLDWCQFHADAESNNFELQSLCLDGTDMLADNEKSCLDTPRKQP
ncbi:hypothetical protein PtB15_3B572 [Puccinia triticina]|nr:hypothetical protein PtB15_3B572 [Puccinia triticina]